MITGHDLLKLGYKPSPQFRQALLLAKEKENQGVSHSEILRHLEENKPREITKLEMRQFPLKVAAAVEFSNQEEEDNVKESIKKMEELSRCPIIESASLMPDTCPSGSEYGCIPVGGAIVTNNAIIPSAHSSDICCSMYATFLPKIGDVSGALNHLQNSTLFGPFSRKEGNFSYHPVLEEENIWANPFLRGLKPIGEKFLQTQGDGNHFAYLGEIENVQRLAKSLDKEGYYAEAAALVDYNHQSLSVLITHHGSRNLGAQLYKRGLEAAERYTKEIANNIPKTAVWLSLETPEGQNYLQALAYSERWTWANHELIHKAFLASAGFPEILTLKNAHNFVWKRDEKVYHGKGATPAWKDEQGRNLLGIIPLNMASNILITFGQDNKEFLSFSPHGAGRNKSRTQTLKGFRDKESNTIDSKTVDTFLKENLGHLDIRWASKRPDLSESPIGYKNPKEIKRQLEHFGLAKIAAEISPKGCIMAGEFEAPWKKLKEEKRLAKAKVKSLIDPSSLTK